VVAELRPYPASTGTWLDDLLLLARRQLALYRSHPWLLDVIQRRSAPGPHTIDYFDNCMRIMAPLHCAVTAKFEAVAMITGVVSLFARSEAAAGPYVLEGVDPEAHPHLSAALNEPTSPASQSDLFERTIRSLLTGLLTH
jgi:hypothetical protein